eukprot:CAMPEP_0177693752 /NCGR_PEP_ID=MMETSP0484_2-20121128/2566_1 /TAXON_ID=354590 /ORGANISM="Rhodomonas lens, Strain RHODO" /LENGTH=292 /DNA_ID=CAMNT_0019204581 /DNA_START=481 /DNA_END=1357 /DNA_ORIENTATION=-
MTQCAVLKPALNVGHPAYDGEGFAEKLSGMLAQLRSLLVHFHMLSLAGILRRRDAEHSLQLHDLAWMDGSTSAEQGTATVQDLLVRVSKEYADGLFTSCKDVTVSATGQKAMEMVFGGASDAAEFLSFQGSSAYSAGQNPLRIAFQLTAAPSPTPTRNSTSAVRNRRGSVQDLELAAPHISLAQLPARRSANKSGTMQADIVGCETSDAALACMCTDCAKACPAAPPQLLDQPWYRWSLGSDPTAGSINILVAAVAGSLVLLYLTAAFTLVAEGAPPPKARARAGEDGGEEL